MLPLWLLVSSGLIAASRGNLSHDRSQPVTSDEVVVAGSKVILSCKVEDPEDSSLQWSNPAQQTLYFGEKRALRDLRIQLENSTANELSISIDNTTLADEGEYTCTIFTRPVRTAKAMVTVLGIPQKPQISGYSGPLREGDVAALTCVSSGSKPAAYLRWKKGDKHLTGQSSDVSKDANGKTFTVSSHIEITVSKEDDGANVTCTVDHASMQISGKSALQRLSVFYKPTAKIEPRPEHPQEGDNLVLHCKGEGNPIPQDYKWEKDGVDTPLLDAQDNILSFPNLNKSDSGTYICYASNLMGNSIARYTLSVSGKTCLLSPLLSGLTNRIAVVGRDLGAFVIFFLLILLIVLGHYLIRHKGTYLTHEAKGSDDAPDADTAIINAEGGQPGGDDKKEYFI
ncbi:cell adhesion molecule 3 [Pseudonaja textilis]|uniref:cell adhesion molecule 3 n=1 Tax=Pseudonaja textilis TaxID=8673 RepID=UPI000EA86D58|nr:cell adhesion molecule 3 [Pseudonaja textilis]